MPVELRKRKAHQVPAEKPAAKKTSGKDKVAKVAKKVKEAVTGKKDSTKPAKTEESKSAAAPAAAAPAAAAPKSGDVTVGETIDLVGFGGEVETNEGVKTSLKKLVDESEGGVILFTYPKASTPGCTRFPYPILYP